MNIKTNTTIKTLLEPTHRYMIRHHHWISFIDGVYQGLRLSVIAGIIFVLIQVFPLAAVERQVFSAGIYIGIICGIMLLSIVWYQVKAYRQRPAVYCAAEGLDHASNRHNIIATSLYLQQRAEKSDFAWAAIKQGYDFLAHISDWRPELKPMRYPWKAVGWYLLLLICTGLISGQLKYNTNRDKLVQDVAEQVPSHNIVPVTAADPPETKEIKPRPKSLTERISTTSQMGNRTTSMDVMPSSGHLKLQTDAQVSSGVVNPPGFSFQNAAASGSKGEQSAASQAHKEKKRLAKAQDRDIHNEPDETLGGDEGKGTSSVGQGKAGGRGGQAVQNTWSQRLSMNEANEPSDEFDESVEDQKEINQHRGGVQPFLKDRNQSPSRELGISSDQGKPGTGRGGPTPPKKSRGTSSLVLGITTPDFVKGRLEAGTNKVTHERTTPQINPGDFARTVPAPQRFLEEGRYIRYRIPNDYRWAVEQYLLSLTRIETEN